jgi:hypothetical protein
MKTNTNSVELMPGAPDFPNNGLLGVGGSIVGALSGFALWHFGAGGYEIFGQILVFLNTHMLMLHIGRYAGFSEYRERFARRARCVLGVNRSEG